MMFKVYGNFQVNCYIDFSIDSYNYCFANLPTSYSFPVITLYGDINHKT